MNPISFLPRSLAVLTATALLAGLAPAQTDYHDQPLLYHLGRMLVLKSSGYRMVSLDVAGDIGYHRWSAVWEPASGNTAWDAIHGVSQADLASWQTTKAAAGYRASWITSAGSGADRVYGCIMVNDGLQAQSYPDMNAASFDAACSSAHTAGYLLVSVSVHGTAADPRYAAVFAENPGKVRWGMMKNQTSAEHQTNFSAFVSQAWARPAIVTQSDSIRYLSVYHDDEIGSWTARHDLTKAGYESTKTTLAASGYRPYQIMVSGIDAAARYAALFVKGTPATMQRTVTGTPVPAFQGVDEVMIGKNVGGLWQNGFLQDTNARAAAVAIAKNGKLVFARGYTWGTSSYPVTQPTTNFRLASCSKPLTAMALYHLMQSRGAVTLDTRLVNTMALGTPADPRVNDITLRHLLNHRSGYNTWWGDGVTNKLQSAQNSIASYTLAFDPDSQQVYSNSGYQMLGLVIEQQSNLSYFNYLQQKFFTPLGINRAKLIASSHQAGNARCQEMGWGGSRTLGVWASPVLAGNPIVNGAYAISDKSLDASGGVDMSVVDYVRLLSGIFDHTVKTNVFTNTTRSNLEAMIEMSGRTGGFDFSTTKVANGKSYRYYEKGGLWRSAHTYVVHRSDNISIAAFCNGPSAPPISQINALIDAVSNWPETDEFPAYGLPRYVTGQDGSSSIFGVGCTGSAGVPYHEVLTAPAINSNAQFRIRNVPAASVAVFVLGASRTMWNGLPLPIGIDFLGAPGCKVYVSQDMTQGMWTQANGTAVTNVAVPNVPQLIGSKVFTQFMSLDPAANALGWTLSNGVESTIGGWW